MEVLRTPPVAASFTPLAEHQSRTPESFFTGSPVLHYHSDRCKVIVLESDLTAAPALNALRGPVVNTNGGAQEVRGETTSEKEIVIDEVDVWVTSEKFLLYRAAATSGVAIPYPSISLHAIQRLRLPSSSSNNTSDDEVQGLYMQIANPVAENMEDDEEEDSLTLTIVAPPVSEAASAALGSFTAGTETVALMMEEMMADEAAGADKPETAVQALFAAVSACSNLHPDPVVHGDEDDEQHPGVGSSLLQAGLIVPGSSDGGLPPPVDGSSGWITAENMDQYFDEEGNWIADGEPPSIPLGPGAGSVRPRDDGHNEEGEEQGHAGDVGGAANGNDGEETKWRRTD